MLIDVIFAEYVFMIFIRKEIYSISEAKRGESMQRIPVIKGNVRNTKGNIIRNQKNTKQSFLVTLSMTIFWF